MAPHHTLALKAVDYGVDKLPDKAFEKIPVAGPRLFKEKDRGKKSQKNQNQNQNDSGSDSSDSEYDRRAPPRRRQRRRERSYTDRGYESDTGTPSNMQYFPPPPTAPVNGPASNGNAPYPPYNPAEFNSSQQPPPNNYASNNSARHSSIADRYRPAGYAPEDTYHRGSSPQQQQQISYPTYQPPDSTALTVRPQDADYAPYPVPPPYSPLYDGLDPAHRGRHHSSSRKGSRDHSRPGSRIREELEKHKEAGVSALGALAGAIIGNELSRKHGKVGMIAGAAIGGIGANVLEKRHEKEKQKKERRDKDGKYDYGYDSY